VCLTYVRLLDTQLCVSSYRLVLEYQFIQSNLFSLGGTSLHGCIKFSAIKLALTVWRFAKRRESLWLHNTPTLSTLLSQYTKHIHMLRYDKQSCVVQHNDRCHFVLIGSASYLVLCCRNCKMAQLVRTVLDAYYDLMENKSGWLTRCMRLTHAENLLYLQLDKIQSPYTVHTSNECW
jgi:hypothetical protein